MICTTYFTLAKIAPFLPKSIPKYKVHYLPPLVSNACGMSLLAHSELIEKIPLPLHYTHRPQRPPHLGPIDKGGLAIQRGGVIVYSRKLNVTTRSDGNLTSKQSHMFPHSIFFQGSIKPCPVRVRAIFDSSYFFDNILRTGVLQISVRGRFRMPPGRRCLDRWFGYSPALVPPGEWGVPEFSELLLRIRITPVTWSHQAWLCLQLLIVFARPGQIESDSIMRFVLRLLRSLYYWDCTEVHTDAHRWGSDSTDIFFGEGLNVSDVILDMHSVISNILYLGFCLS